MKRRLNLYHASLRPIKETLTSKRILFVLFTVFMLGILVRSGYEYALVKLDEQDAGLTQEVESANNQIVELANQLRQRQPLQNLLRQAAKVELDISSRQALLAEFEKRGRIQRDNLSPVLNELGSIHTQGVWLTGISITPEGVMLEGSTLDATLIPQWMAKFAQTSILSKHQFSVVDLQRDSNRVLNFAIGSKGKVNNQQELIEKQMEGIKLDEILVPEV